jgi:hypothetical protein
MILPFDNLGRFGLFTAQRLLPRYIGVPGFRGIASGNIIAIWKS